MTKEELETLTAQVRPVLALVQVTQDHYRKQLRTLEKLFGSEAELDSSDDYNEWSAEGLVDYMTSQDDDD